VSTRISTQRRVDGYEAFYARCTANGARIVKPLTATPWSTMDFYVEDPDG
jgi:uncharacterized glyoxalase superfamily protein PhnB